MRTLVYLLSFSLLALTLALAQPAAPRTHAAPPGQGADQPAPLLLQRQDRIGGALRGAVLADKWLYVARGRETVLYDVSDPTILLEGARIAEFTVRAAVGGYLYGPQVGTPGVTVQWAVWDVRNPTAPQRVGTFTPIGELVAADDCALYFRRGPTADPIPLRIYSLATPTLPTLASSWAEFDNVATVIPIGSRILVSGFHIEGGPRNPVEVYDPLAVVDVSNPANPVRVSTVPATQITPAPLFSAVDGNLLYLANRDEFYITRLEANGTLTTLKRVAVGRVIGSLSYNQGYLYVGVFDTGGLNPTQIWDVRQPATAELIAEVPILVSGATQGDYIFRAVAQGPNNYPPYSLRQITIFDVSQPTIPQAVAEIRPPDGQEVLATPSYVYLVDWDKQTPIPTFYLHTLARATDGTLSVARTDLLPDSDYDQFKIVADEFLYAVRGVGGSLQTLQIFRLPTATTALELVGEGPPASRVAILNRTMVVDDNSSATPLTVYDLDDPATPTLAATLPLTEFSSATDDGDRLYLGIYTQPMTVTILDVDDPTAPVVLGSYSLPDPTTGYPSHIAAWAGHLYYQEAYQPDIYAVDLTTPTQPGAVQTLPRIGGGWRDPALKGVWEGHLYVQYLTATVGSIYGLAVYDLSRPATPFPVGFYIGQNAGDYELVEAGNHLYLLTPPSAQGVSTIELVAGRRQFLPVVGR